VERFAIQEKIKRCIIDKYKIMLLLERGEIHNTKAKGERFAIQVIERGRDSQYKSRLKGERFAIQVIERDK